MGVSQYSEEYSSSIVLSQRNFLHLVTVHSTRVQGLEVNNDQYRLQVPHTSVYMPYHYKVGGTMFSESASDRLPD